MNTPKLLILDINGVLGYKVNKNLKIGGTRLIEMGGSNFNFLSRIGVKQFLNHCYKNYFVAFYSSTSERNAKSVLKKILTLNQRNATRFEWFRDRTEFDPETVDFETIKNLERVFGSPLVNRKRYWNSNNTIIVDDEFTKLRFNDPKNCVIVKAANLCDEMEYIYEMIRMVDEAFLKLDIDNLSNQTFKKLNIVEKSLKEFDDNADDQWQEYCEEIKNYDLLAESEEEEEKKYLKE